MAGYHDTVKAMERDYKLGRLEIRREGGKVLFSGSTYGCKEVIKGMVPAGCAAAWNKVEKRWEVESDEIKSSYLALLEDITGGELVEFAGYVNDKPVFVWK